MHLNLAREKSREMIQTRELNALVQIHKDASNQAMMAVKQYQKIQHPLKEKDASMVLANIHTLLGHTQM